MKKSGFAFIETIITIVILSSSLLYLYHTYSAILIEEEKRLRYDDPAFIYKSNYIRKLLLDNNNATINNIFELLSKNDDKNNTNGNNNTNSRNQYITIGYETDNLFKDEEFKDKFKKITETFSVSRMIIIKGSLSNDDISDLGINLKQYLGTLDIKSDEYYLVIEYGVRSSRYYKNKKNTDNNNETFCYPFADRDCDAYYVSLKVGGA